MIWYILTDTFLWFQKAISGTDLSHSKLIPHFVRMGFPEELVAKAIEENGNCTTSLIFYRYFRAWRQCLWLFGKCAGEGNSESILETLLTYSVSNTHFILSNSWYFRLDPRFQQDLSHPYGQKFIRSIKRKAAREQKMNSYHIGSRRYVFFWSLLRTHLLV